MFMGRSLTAANHQRGQLWSQTWMLHTTRVILRKPRCLRTTKFFSWRTVKSRTTCRRQDLIPNVELWKSLDQPSISQKLFDNHLHWTVLSRPWNSSSAAMSEMTVRQGSDVKPHWKNWLLSEEKKVQVLIWASPMTNDRHPRCVPGIASGQAAGWKSQDLWAFRWFQLDLKLGWK